MNIKDIKFKAKRLDNGEWVEGDLIHKNNGVYVYNPQIVNKRGYSVQSIRIDSHTVCMFTGLKDKNGTPIYEGDIVIYKDNNTERRGAITWDSKATSFCFVQDFLVHYPSENMIVVGNKFNK